MTHHEAYMRVYSGYLYSNSPYPYTPRNIALQRMLVTFLGLTAWARGGSKNLSNT